MQMNILANIVPAFAQSPMELQLRLQHLDIFVFLFDKLVHSIVIEIDISLMLPKLSSLIFLAQT